MAAGVRRAEARAPACLRPSLLSYAPHLATSTAAELKPSRCQLKRNACSSPIYLLLVLSRPSQVRVTLCFAFAEMVGVPRSHGCTLCLQRRVKCDQARPACQNCSRYGANCPGYQRELKFVSNKHQIRPRRRRDQTIVRSSAQTSTAASTAGQTDWESVQSALVYDTGALEREISFSTGDLVGSHDMRSRSSIPVHLWEPRGPYINALLDTLRAGLGADELAFVYPWFQSIGQYVGLKVTLDSALTSLIMQMLGRRLKDHRLIGESHQLYGRSLSALQAALNSKSEWKTTETLCTTWLLCHFEVTSRLTMYQRLILTACRCSQALGMPSAG